MAITQAMRASIFGRAAAVALALAGSDASADLAGPRGVPSMDVHHGMTLAKARKRGRRPASSGKPAAEPADDASGGDDGASSSSSSSASDDAQEDEVLGSKKKKKAPAAADDGSSSGGGGGEETAKGSSKEVETVASKASEESDDESPAPALEFGLGAKALFRQLAWTSDARAAGLGPYSLTPGPETSAWFEFYPAAFGTSGFAGNVGLFGRLDYGFGVATTLANNNNVATKFRDFMAGLKVRIPLGMMIPNISVAYGQQTFEIAPAMNALDLPKVAYSFIRPALGTRVIFAPGVALDVAAAYLMVIDPGSGTGYVKGSTFFPNAKALGFDLSASLAYRITGAIGARGGVEMRQYSLTMNDSTAPTVGGAVDRYITMFAGIEVVLDGQGAAGDDDEPKPSKRKRRRAEPKEDEASDNSSSDDKTSEDE
jgi:hypothetical protein